MSSLRYPFVLASVLAVLITLSGFQQSSRHRSPASDAIASYQASLLLMISQIDSLEHQMKEDLNPEIWRNQFLRIRRTYKTIEYLVAYTQPELTVQRLNGAPLPKVDPMEENVPVVINPVGIQVIDEALYLEEEDHIAEAVLPLLAGLKRELVQLEMFHRKLYLSDRQIFEACRDELIRVYTLGMTGFDTPGSGQAMEDALIVFQQMETTMSGYVAVLGNQHRNLSQTLQQKLAGASLYLADNQNFDTFDRLAFLRNYLDPLFAGLLDAQLALDIETMYEVSDYVPSLNYFARNLFSDSLLQLSSYVGAEASSQLPAMVKLGKLLFYDPILSHDMSMSCASCHHPGKAFTDGQRKSLATGLQGTVDRNAPTLINAVYSDRYFHDLRTFELEMQIDHVVFEEREFNTTYRAILQRLSASEEYLGLFAEAFPHYSNQERPALNTSTLKSALAAYVASLRGFNSPFDQYARGESNDLDESAKRGYNLFMGKAVCGTCHFAPAFTGLVPPDYQDSESEVIGVPEAPIWEGATLDPDLGRRVNGVPLDAVDIHHHSFKTPTVRNIALTAPYMHNGVYDSLEQIVRFYNIGGGAGIGIEMDNQTLPFDALNLNSAEMQDIASFMRSLTDTTGMTSVPSRLPSFEGHEEWNKRKIGGEY